MRNTTSTSNGHASEKTEDVAKELHEIKRLLILLLLKGGASQSEIGRALKCSQSTVSEKYGFGEVETLVTGRE